MKFQKLLKKLMVHSDHHTHKISCVIAKGDKVLGVGFNSLKTHPRSPHKFKSSHAEFKAALDAGEEIRGATAYVYREQRDGSWAMSRPCDTCWQYLMECGVKEIVYSFEGTFKKERVS